MYPPPQGPPLARVLVVTPPFAWPFCRPLSYYAEVLKLPPDAAKLHLTLPHLTAMLVKLAVSSVAGAVQSAGYSMLATRRLMCATGYTRFSQCYNL